MYCGGCRATAENGIIVEEIRLNPLNDIYMKGTCNDCKGPVGRTMEFGEDKELYDRAMQLRGSISKRGK